MNEVINKVRISNVLYWYTQIKKKQTLILEIYNIGRISKIFFTFLGKWKNRFL